MGTSTKVGIIGCGLIGQKRAQILEEGQLIACADTNENQARALASRAPGCASTTNWQDLIDNKHINIIIVATPHNLLAPITLAAVQAGKHVLVEKPAGLNAAEIQPIIEASHIHNVCIRVGFNHRYHRAFRQAHELLNKNVLGDLMFLRARYGHGGRIGYDKEWRANPEISGGGELIDQGVHLIDLSRWILGDFEEVEGFAHTYYWDMPVDDNGFLLLKTVNKQAAFLHASCTEWKNTFSMEIYGRKGKLTIEGLGGSYGTEKLTWYKMLPEMGPPATTSWEYPMADNSWQSEWIEFLEDIRLQRQPAANLNDAQAALKIVEQIYEVSK